MESIDKPDLGTDVNLINKDLPLYPDVVVHYRCSDNIALRGRGLTQFHTILNAIPSTAQYVMILTEGGDLSSLIVEELRRRIMAKFPSILQVISRSGGNILGSTFTIVKAKTLICSVSSFCLYFGALNSEGNVYMPTRLYYGHHINLDNFHTLENNAAVTFWKNPNGSRIEIPLFHYSLDDPAYDSKLQVTIKQMIAVLQNETYTHVTDQIHCKIKNIAKPGETALNTCT